MGFVIDSAKSARVVGTHGGAPRVDVVLVDERDLDAPVGERVLQQVDVPP